VGEGCLSRSLPEGNGVGGGGRESVSRVEVPVLICSLELPFPDLILGCRKTDFN